MIEDSRHYFPILTRACEAQVFVQISTFWFGQGFISGPVLLNLAVVHEGESVCNSGNLLGQVTDYDDREAVVLA